MNLSGLVLPHLSAWLHGGRPAPAEPCVVVLDDIDLPLGEIRIRRSGGDGGHRGMRSILETLGTEAVPRVRVGIGRPRTDAARHVLERFQPDELPVVEGAAASAAEFLLDWLLGGDWGACVARFHSRKSPGGARLRGDSRGSPSGPRTPPNPTDPTEEGPR
jgi:PTH1 family peptidyl-tRNA hydrolase